MPSRLIAITLLAGTLGASPAADLADPTQPPARPAVHIETEGLPATPRLSSIRLSPSDRIALIDGRPVRVGDKVDDSLVVAIDLAGVRLRTVRGEISLTLWQGSVKRSSSRHRSSR